MTCGGARARWVATLASVLVATGLAGVAAPSAHAAPASPAAPAIAAPHSLSIRLLDEPSALDKDPRAGAYVIDELRPATTITRQVEVRNDTGHPTTVALYPSAATIGPTGWGIDAGETPNELTGWTSISPSSIALAAGASIDATVTIAVPADATSGERYEGLVAALPPAAGSGSLLVENRVAIRVYLAVASPRSPLPPSDFTISTLQARRLPDGTPQVTATIRNTGGRALDLTGVLRLTDGPGGVSAGPYATAGATTLGIGASGQVTVNLSKDIPAGPWKARIDATSGLLHRAATGEITFPAAGGSAVAVPAKAVPLAKDRHVLIPLVAGLLLLVLIGLLIVFWRRRHDEDEEEPVRSAPDLESAGHR